MRENPDTVFLGRIAGGHIQRDIQRTMSRLYFLYLLLYFSQKIPFYEINQYSLDIFDDENVVK